MDELDPAHHIFRHIPKTKMQDGIIDSSAFWLRMDKATGRFIDDGLSVNWVEYFQKAAPQEAIVPLRDMLETKKNKRTIGGESKFALLNVRAVKEAAAKYVPVTVVLDEEEGDPSHALVKGYETFNEEVAEEILKVVIAAYHPPPRARS